jgi:hypothetical protein
MLSRWPSRARQCLGGEPDLGRLGRWRKTRLPIHADKHAHRLHDYGSAIGIRVTLTLTHAHPLHRRYLRRSRGARSSPIICRTLRKPTTSTWPSPTPKMQPAVSVSLPPSPKNCSPWVWTYLLPAIISGTRKRSWITCRASRSSCAPLTMRPKRPATASSWRAAGKAFPAPLSICKAALTCRIRIALSARRTRSWRPRPVRQSALRGFSCRSHQRKNGVGQFDLWGGQFCPQPAFSRLWPPKKAAAAKIGRPTSQTDPLPKRRTLPLWPDVAPAPVRYPKTAAFVRRAASPSRAKRSPPRPSPCPRRATRSVA